MSILGTLLQSRTYQILQVFVEEEVRLNGYMAWFTSQWKWLADVVPEDCIIHLISEKFVALFHLELEMNHKSDDGIVQAGSEWPVCPSVKVSTKLSVLPQVDCRNMNTSYIGLITTIIMLSSSTVVITSSKKDQSGIVVIEGLIRCQSLSKGRRIRREVVRRAVQTEASLCKAPDTPDGGGGGGGGEGGDPGRVFGESCLLFLLSFLLRPYLIKVPTFITTDESQCFICYCAWSSMSLYIVFSSNIRLEQNFPSFVNVGRTMKPAQRGALIACYSKRYVRKFVIE
ncbi:hypothetical protein Tco_0803965 [Tanacetum coccineum]|uniref:Uncharacterized protein n=1 Tax=Tanacetum coccineum TaxID=301880 RepID=A0ABQ5A6U4_9ASTR